MVAAEQFDLALTVRPAAPVPHPGRRTAGRLGELYDRDRALLHDTDLQGESRLEYALAKKDRHRLGRLSGDEPNGKARRREVNQVLALVEIQDDVPHPRTNPSIWAAEDPGLSGEEKDVVAASAN